MKRYLYASFILVLFASLFAVPANAQLKLKLKFLPTTDSWAVYVKPDPNVTPSVSTITGSGQITVVAPRGFVLGTVTNSGGSWTMNARANGPRENPSRDYLSFGFLSDSPALILKANEETLLFSFKRTGNCPDTLYLIDNQKDPFAKFPNSLQTNPGNGLTIFDNLTRQVYEYSGNYNRCAWNCKVPCDKADIVASAHDLAAELGVSVFPNPAQNFITVETAGAIIEKITVRNIAGQALLEQTGGSEQVNLSLENIPTGIYGLEILTEKGSLLQKLVVGR